MFRILRQALVKEIGVFSFICTLSFTFLQFFLGTIFVLVVSRHIQPFELGSWATAVFCFNFYASITDWNLELNLFASECSLLQQIAAFTLRLVFGSIPFIFLSLLALFYPVNKLFVLYAAFFFLERVCFFLRSVYDKSLLQLNYTSLEIISLFFSYIISFSALFFKVPIFPLALQKIIEKLILSILSFFYLPEVTDPSLSFVNSFFLGLWTEIKGLASKFAVPTLGSGLAGVVIYDSVPFVLNFLVNPSSAGFFARAYMLANLPLLITVVLNRLAMPIYSAAIRNNISDLRVRFLQVQLLKICLIFPAVIFLEGTSSFWFMKLLGEQWLPALPIFRLFLIYGFFRSLYEDMPTFINLGLRQPMLFTYNQIIHAICVSIGFILLVLTNSLWLFYSYLVGCMIFVVIRLWIILFLWA